MQLILTYNFLLWLGLYSNKVSCGRFSKKLKFSLAKQRESFFATTTSRLLTKITALYLWLPRELCNYRVPHVVFIGPDGSKHGSVGRKAALCEPVTKFAHSKRGSQQPIRRGMSDVYIFKAAPEWLRLRSGRVDVRSVYFSKYRLVRF